MLIYVLLHYVLDAIIDKLNILVECMNSHKILCKIEFSRFTLWLLNDDDRDEMLISLASWAVDSVIFEKLFISEKIMQEL